VIRKGERLKNLVTEIFKRHDFADVYGYAIDPPKNVLIKLKTTNSHRKCYQAYEQILGVIRQIFSSAVENLSVAPLGEVKIRSLNNALQFLSDELQNLFKSKIDELGKVMINKEEAYRETLNTYFF
jgi:hypothetical protein